MYARTTLLLRQQSRDYAGERKLKAHSLPLRSCGVMSFRKDSGRQANVYDAGARTLFMLFMLLFGRQKQCDDAGWPISGAK
jgi:hypothetical protein